MIVSVNGSPTLCRGRTSAKLLSARPGSKCCFGIKTAKAGTAAKVVVKPMSANGDCRLARSRMGIYAGGWRSNELGAEHRLSAFAGDGRRRLTEFGRGVTIPVIRQGRADRRRTLQPRRQHRSVDRRAADAQGWFYLEPVRRPRTAWNMQYAFRGHIVILCNEWTASDGEAFCEGRQAAEAGHGDRHAHLGRRDLAIANNRSWTGASPRPPSTACTAGRGLAHRRHGVDPDIVVDNLPHATFKGEDAQLATAVKLLKQKLKDEPVTLPQEPPFPKK